MADLELEPDLSPKLIKIMEQRQPDASAEEYARAIKELRKLSTSMDLISRLRATTKEINALRTLIDECSQEKTCLIW
ncbi:hypothetical protein FF1_001423 [Malus domestica]